VTRLGRWIDFENDYKTMDPSFMESVWWVFSQLWAKGLVYKGFKVRVGLFLSAWVGMPALHAGARLTRCGHSSYRPVLLNLLQT